MEPKKVSAETSINGELNINSIPAKRMIEKPNRLKSFSGVLGNNKVMIALIVLCAILSLMSDRFLDINNLENILLQSAIMGVVAVGMNYVIITAGIDLSVGSVLGLSSVVIAGLASSGVPIIIVLLAGIIVGVIAGGLNGFFITKFNMTPFIVTLGVMAAARSIALVYTDAKTISIYDNAFFKVLRTDSLLGIPIMIIIPIIVFLIGHYILHYTIFGRHVYAVGNNKKAAELSGINVKRIELTVYAISGFLAGVAGILMTARLGSGTPLAGSNLELMAIAAVVIGGSSLMGGRGTIFGTMVGVLLINVINTGMNLMNISSHYQGLIMGGVIILAAFIDSYGNKK